MDDFKDPVLSEIFQDLSHAEDDKPQKSVSPKEGDQNLADSEFNTIKEAATENSGPGVNDTQPSTDYSAATATTKTDSSGEEIDLLPSIWT